MGGFYSPHFFWLQDASILSFIIIQNMKDKKQIPLEGQIMSLVPQETLIQLIAGQERILRAISEKAEKKDSIGDYISETEAKKILGRKSTWFWNLRKKGKLAFTKVGNKIFYSRADILSFIELNKISTSNG